MLSMLHSVLLTSLFFPAVFAIVEPHFLNASIVPDVLDVTPSDWLIVNFGGFNKAVVGNELTPEQTANEPAIWYDRLDTKTLYTVVMVDPDALSRKNPIYREWRHWLVVNAPYIRDHSRPGWWTRKLNVDKGKVISTYQGPEPPKGSGLHRYVALLYKQSKKLGKVNVGEDDRANFHVKEFAKRYGLEIAAGNFFVAKS